MKISEFYEKYWRVVDPSTREPIKIKLPEREKAIMDKADELSLPPYVRVYRRMLGGHRYIVHPEVEKALALTPPQE